MISEKLAAIYNKAEDKYFDLLDFLDSKGIPVYTYSDFFENKGIPSFVVTISILLILLIALAVIFTYQGPDVGQLTLSLKDSDGKGLTGVSLVITDKQGIELYKGTAADGQKIGLGRALYTSDKIYIAAEKDGYKSVSLEYTIGENNNSPRLRFSKDFVSIEAKIRLVDKETKTVINGATAILTADDLSYELIEDGNNFYSKTGIPSGEDLSLKVTAEGYNDYEQSISFLSGQVKEIQLDPSTQAYVGKAAVGISVKGIDEKLIDDVKVTVYNKQNDTIEVSDYTRNGTLVASITAGVPLRITAEKDGYLTYDSEKSGDGVTIREKEKQINITLEQGGQELHVTVNDSSLGLSLEGAKVQIFNSDLSLFGEATTSISGADFSGLDPTEMVYITAYLDGYLPAREKVAVSSTEEVKLLLTKVSATNSARLDIYSIDSKGNAVNGINVVLNEIVDGNVVPSGIPLLQTSFAGYVNAVVEGQKTYQAYGYSDAFEATATVELAAGDMDKKVYLNMQKKLNVIEMKFLDVFGKNITGTATVDGLDAVNLYDGNIFDGSVYFDGEQRETVDVTVDLPDGNIFNENVIIKGKTYVEVVVYSKDTASLTPTIEFIGLENENGDSVKGITPGAFYWAKFSVNYPRAASKAGINFRAGSDSTPLAESEKVGIYDFAMQNASVSYSSSYTPTPEPGNEAVDRANASSQGEKSKWVEGIVVQPKGTYTVKVKLRVEDYTPGKVQLKYRAWAIVGDEYYRNPADDDLLLEGYTDTKSGLYASTLTQDLTLYESLPDCTDTICITTNFVDSEENLLDTEKFEALKDKLYALEVEVTSQEQDYIQVDASSDTNINFDSTQTGSLYFAREEINSTSIKKSASTSVSVAQEGKQKVRFYFTAGEIGSGKIKLTVTGKATVERELNFKVVNEKTLLVELSEDQVIVGRNFTIKVTDSGLNSMGNALVKIIDKEGKTQKTILGDNTDGKGKNGYYRVTNNLSVGLYTVEVSSSGYATNTTPFLVTTRNVFSFPETIEVKMPQGQKVMSIDELLTNNTDFVVQDISYDVTGGETEDETELDVNTGEEITAGGFVLTAEVPVALSKNQKQNIPITARFTGADDDSADETVTLTISGLVEGKFLAKVSSEIHLIYNRQLDPSCLKVDDTTAVINLIGSEGTSDSTSIEVTNNCDQAITLKKRIRAKTKLSGVQLDAEDYLDLQAGESQDIVITAYNGAERARDESYGFELIYDSNYLKKTIDLTVKLINPNLALSYPSQVTLYLAQGAINDKATAAQPIYITNISAFPIENISLSQGSTYTASGLKLEVQPSASVNLERGQSITPAKVLFATANSKITEPVETTLEITGRFGNLNNKAAQYDRYQYYDMYNEGLASLSNYSPNSSNLASYTNTNRTLGVIRVLAVYSGYNCLKASLADSTTDPYMFPSAGVQIGKMVTVTNQCAEPVLISGVTPATYTPTKNVYGGVNPLASSVMLFVPQVLVQPNAAVKVPLSITTTTPTVNREKYEIVVNGVTQLSQTLISSKPFSVKLYSGTVLTDEKSKSTKIKVRECASPNSKEPAKEVELVAPLTTDSANCSDRYCDAQNAAKYLAQKIEQVAQKARSAGYSKKDVTEDGFPCQLEGACTFAEIGMDEEEIFDLYLQNDSISMDMLYKELNGLNNDGGNDTPYREGAYLSSGFLVEPILVDMTYIKSRILAGYTKTVFFDPSFSGCGYYQVSISGAFKAGTDGLDTMNPVLILRAKQINGANRLVTKECQNEIGNITNFNPVDSGLNSGKEYGSWLTTINPDNKFLDMAKQISKSRYKTEDRVTGSSNGNTITITQGALSNALAQICVSGSDKKAITVTVDSSIASNFDAKQKDTFAQSIVQLVSNTLGGKFGDNCVTGNGDIYNCINLSELGNLGDRKMSFLSNDLLFSSTSGGCISGTIYSTINESLEFTALPVESMVTPFYGVREITVSTDDSVARPIVLLDAVTSNTTTTAGTTNTATPTGTAAQTGTNTQTPQPNNSTTPAKTQTPQTGSTTGKLENEETTAGKIFFADAIAPNTEKSSAGTYKVASGTLYDIKFSGANLNPETIKNESLQLIPNTLSKQYKYYRNIKVCAYPTDVDSTGKASLTEYTKANGVKFDLGVRNTLSNETTEDIKQTVTINTGTLHPDDLAKFICSSSTTWKTDYKYYFTTGWNATLNEDMPELGEYFEGLKRQGIVDKCILWTDQSGMSGTKEYDTLANKSTEQKLWAYLLACSATSAACNGLSSGGVTLIGAVLYGPAFDCGLPLLTTHRAEIAQSSELMSKINSFAQEAANLPVVGSTIKTLFAVKEDLPLADAEPSALYQVGETFADSFLTRLATQGWDKITTPWAVSTQNSLLAKVVNYTTAAGSSGSIEDKLELAKTPLAIRNYSKDAATQLGDAYEAELRRIATPASGALSAESDTAIKSLISDFKKEMEKSIKEKLTASANKTYTTGNRVLSVKGNALGTISSEDYTKAIKDSLEEGKAKFTELLSKTDTTGGNSNFKKIFGLSDKGATSITADDALKVMKNGSNDMAAIGNAIDRTDRVSTEILSRQIKSIAAGCTRHVTPGSSVTSPVTGAVTTTAAVITALSSTELAKCKKDLETVLNNNKVADASKKADELATRFSSITDPEQINKINGQADDALKAIDDLISAPAKNTESIVKSASEKVNATVEKNVKTNYDSLNKKAKATTIKSLKNFGLNLGIGVACSVASDKAGELAMNKVESVADAAMKDASRNALNLSVTLQKNKTYALAITKNYGKWNYSVVEVSSASDREEMERTIADKKGEIISTKKLIDSKILSTTEKMPEERKLSYWMINTSISVAKTLIATKNYPFDDTVAAKQMEILEDKNIRQLIFDYTNSESQRKIVGASESDVIAVMLYFWDAKGAESISSQIEKEAAGKANPGLLKQYTNMLITAKKNHDSQKGTTLTASELRTAFGKLLPSSKEADDFSKTVSFWKMVQTSSPNISTPVPNSASSAPTAASVPVEKTASAN